MKWNTDKINLIKAYLSNGMTIAEMGKSMKLSYKSIEHAIHRYNLRDCISQNSILTLDAKKLKKEDVDKLAKTIGERLYGNYNPIKLKSYKPRKCKGKREEVSILDISDVHVGMKNECYITEIGKKVVTYNDDIFKKELGIMYSSISEIHSILSGSYNLKKIVIFMIGDIITNDRIFMEQKLEIEKVVGLQVWDAINHFTNFFNELLKVYNEIEIVGVVGNHGRSLPDSYNEPVQNNFEYFLYRVLEKQFEKEKRINIIVPDSHRYVHKIYGWKHLIEHGDSMRGNTDSYIEKQIRELYTNMGGFDVFHFGHFHKLKEREIADKVIVKQNGCWIEKDNFAFKKYKTYSVPKQHFFGCSSKRPETWAYKLDLRG